MISREVDGLVFISFLHRNVIIGNRDALLLLTALSNMIGRLL